MIGKFVLKGLLAGLAGALLAFLFAKLIGETSVDGAIAVEQRLAGAAGEAAEPELVSRSMQASWGLFVGVVAYGTALGGIFGLVFAFAQGRMGGLVGRSLAALLAVTGFVAIIVVPFLKYPANPPSVGLAETIQYRTGLYFGMVVISLVAMIAVINLGRSLFTRLDRWHATGIAALVYLAIVGAAQMVLPNINEVPEAFPAVLLWQFRVSSLGLQLLLWGAIGLIFGELIDRGGARRPGSGLSGRPSSTSLRL